MKQGGGSSDDLTVEKRGKQEFSDRFNGRGRERNSRLWEKNIKGRGFLKTSSTHRKGETGSRR